MTDGSVRRAEIAALLEKADSPLSAAHLASQLGVSRQVIVGDIALLRASGADITATPRGYITERAADCAAPSPASTTGPRAWRRSSTSWWITAARCSTW